MVADGVITPDDYMGKLTDFVGRRTVAVRGLNNQGVLWRQFQATEEFYQKKQKQSNAKIKNKEEEKLLWKILRLKICMI